MRLGEAAVLTRTIPARRETVQVAWVKPDFMLFGRLKDIRDRHKQRTSSRCWWCRKPFGREDMVALAGFKRSVNRCICQGCCDALIEKEIKDE